jgi:flagellar hook assembly protein FlgD
VSLTIYDTAGRRVASLVDRTLPAGEHALRWDGRTEAGVAAPSGLYFVRLQAGAQSAVRRLAKLD